MRNSINFIYIFKEGDGDEDYGQNEQNAGATGGASDYSTPKTQPSPKKMIHPQTDHQVVAPKSHKKKRIGALYTMKINRHQRIVSLNLSNIICKALHY